MVIVANKMLRERELEFSALRYTDAVENVHKEVDYRVPEEYLHHSGVPHRSYSDCTKALYIASAKVVISKMATGILRHPEGQLASNRPRNEQSLCSPE